MNADTFGDSAGNIGGGCTPVHLEKELTKYDEPGRAQCQGQDMKEVYAELSKMNWFIAYVVLSENEQRTLKKACCFEFMQGHTLR